MIWQVGKKLQSDRYEIKQVLGAGRLSVTYLAQVLKGEQQGDWMVIKAPNDEAMQRSDFDRLQEVFTQEALKLMRCRHPHIVRAKESFLEDGIRYVSMEWIPGTTLDKRTPMQPEKAVKYVQQIGEALQVVHANDLLHRDVTPANIMLRPRSDEREAVLIDFGLARAFDQDLTQVRTEEITPGFTPPELYSRDADRGPFTDLYSLGATLYNLLTGKTPPNAIDRKTANAPLDFSDHISPRIRQAIEWAMALEGGDRPQSVQEWLDALGQDTQAPIYSSPSVNSSDSQPRSQKINWTTFWTAAGVIVALLTLVIQQCMGNNPPTAPSSSPTQTTSP